jgi:hypothetical protein
LFALAGNCNKGETKVTVLHSGTTTSYSNNWADAFGGKKKSNAPKKKVVKKAAATKVKKSAGKKTAKKKTRK